MKKADYIGKVVGIIFLNGDKVLGRIKDMDARTVTVVTVNHKDEVTFSKSTIKRALVLIQSRKKEESQNGVDTKKA